MMYLYKLKSSDLTKQEYFNNYLNVKLEIFKPSIFGGLFMEGERKGIDIALSRIVFQLMTLGKSYIYYVQRENKLVHTSYVVPACIKFPFMERGSLEIGPCYTYPKYRGLGIYTEVLRQICRINGNDVSSFYMIVDELNCASIRGIEKAGFVKYGNIRKSRITKFYKLV